MSPRDRALWMRFQRRANSLAPALRKELLDAFQAIRDALTDEQVTSLIEQGRFDAIVDDALLDRSLRPLREKLVESVQRGFKATVPDLPKAGRVDGQMAVGFDTLNPRNIDAVRQLDSRVVNTLKEEVRDVARAYVENGLRDGKSAKAIGRELRQVIGMSPRQAENAAKYEAKLRALVKHPLTDAQIEKKVAAYTKRAVAQNAEVNARTATLDSLKLGQHLSWQDAIDQGIVKREDLWKRWTTVGDDRVRDEHVAMNGEEVPFSNFYSNGEDVPGQSTFNCRCISRYFIKRAA